MKHPFALGALAGLTALALAVPAVADATTPAATSTAPTTVSFQPSDAVIANPERGFYHHTETHYRADGSGYTPLDQATLAGYRSEGITQILRVFYLEKFAQQPTLEQQWLDLVQADYDTARAAGVSVITRFAYVQGGDWPYEPPYGDAPVDVVLAHIEQLGPVLRANADVIATVQNGFIGLWGEGYYTDHFVADPADPGVVTEADWANRAAVVDALLRELPVERGVQVRTMLTKQQTFDVPSGRPGALTPRQAYDGSDLARVGHHNDCLLASPDDFGTFLSDPLSLDQTYLAADSRYVPQGGETCAVNPPRSEWASASAELARYHYSYLNADYNTDVLDSWGAANLEQTARSLGYRLVLDSATLTPTAGRAQTVAIELANEGWAAPYNQRDAVLVLTGEAGRFEVPLRDGDVRQLAPGSSRTLRARVVGLPTGQYELSLSMPAAADSVADDPRYAIQTANLGTWDPATGLNDLGLVLTAP